MEGEKNLFGEDQGETTGAKKKPRHTKVVFKPDTQKQAYLLPPTLDEMVPATSIARFVNEIVDRIDTSEMIAKYKGGGAGAYHPATLLKIWLLGWCQKIYTARPLEQALRRSIEFMWISGNQKPTYVTLSAFRKGLGEDIKKVFRATVRSAIRAGMMDGSELYIDHTKMEADANKYKVTWKKNIDRYLAKVNADIDIFFETVDRLNTEEEQNYSALNREEAITKITPDLVAEVVEQINEEIKAGKKDRELGKAEKAVLREGLKKIERKAVYERKLEILDGRSGMSNTDTDASSMMMKDKVTIRPGYNVGIATQNGLVTGFDVSNNANDSTSFQAVLKDAQEHTECKPDKVCADAGYGTYEIYTSLENENIEAFIKYPGWLRDEKNKRGKFEAVSFTYDKEQDRYQCPAGNWLSFHHQYDKKNKRTGFVETVRRYEAEERVCASCPCKAECTGAKARVIQVNRDLNRYRAEARARLKTDEGLRMRSRRGIEDETVFGDQKRNWHFHRFHLRGLSGATIESGLYYTTWNIRKLHNYFVAWMESMQTGRLLLVTNGVL